MDVMVRLARDNELQRIAEWMARPDIAPALDLRPRVDASILANGGLPVFDTDGRPTVDYVRIFTLGLGRDNLYTPFGFAIDYGWDTPDDDIRELDIAIVEAPDAFCVLQAMARLSHALFSEFGASEIRARTREGGNSAGFPRLFSAIGAREVCRPDQLEPRHRQRTRRVLYALTAARFYGSRAARRYHCMLDGTE